MSDDELYALYWAAFEAEVRALYRGDNADLAEVGWETVKRHVDTPSLAGLRAVFETGVNQN